MVLIVYKYNQNNGQRRKQVGVLKRPQTLKLVRFKSNPTTSRLIKTQNLH